MHPRAGHVILSRVRARDLPGLLPGLLTVLVACGLGLATAAAEPADDDAAPRVTAIRCTRPGLSVRPPPPIVARWDHRKVEAGVGAIEVRWCGPGEATLHRLTLGPVTRWRAVDGAPVRLRAGQAAIFTVAGTAAASEVPLTVTAGTAAGPVVARATLVSVDDPERARARRACTACGGDWGHVGVAQLEGCDCATTDAGARCESDGDCQGYCTSLGWEPIAGTCPAGQRRERAIGRCSDHRGAFACVGWDARQERCATPGAPDRPGR